MRKHQGITIIEIMLLFALLILLSVIIFSFSFHKEKIMATAKEQQDILMLENALKFYKLHNGFYPSTSQGLEALVQKPVLPPVPMYWIPYASEIPVDSSGRPYHYENDDEKIEVTLEKSK